MPRLHIICSMLVDLLKVMASTEAGKEEEEKEVGGWVGSRHRILLCNVPNDV